MWEWYVFNLALPAQANHGCIAFLSPHRKEKKKSKSIFAWCQTITTCTFEPSSFFSLNNTLWWQQWFRRKTVNTLLCWWLTCYRSNKFNERQQNHQIQMLAIVIPHVIKDGVWGFFLSCEAWSCQKEHGLRQTKGGLSPTLARTNVRLWSLYEECSSTCRPVLLFWHSGRHPTRNNTGGIAP